MNNYMQPKLKAVRKPVRYRGDEVRHRLGRIFTYSVITFITFIIICWLGANVYLPDVASVIGVGVYLSFVFFVGEFAGIRLPGTPLRIYFPYLPSIHQDRGVEVHFLPSRIILNRALSIWNRALTVLSLKKSGFRTKIALADLMLDQTADAVAFGLLCGYKQVSVASHLIRGERVAELIARVRALDLSVSVEIKSEKHTWLNTVFLWVFTTQGFVNLRKSYPKVIFKLN